MESVPAPQVPPAPKRRRVLNTGLLLLVVVLLGAGLFARSRLSLEFSIESLESVRTWVLGFGWQAPVVFVALMTFRAFLLLPSALVLTLGGLAFGGATGTILGTAGIVLSAAYKYGLARGLGLEWVFPRLGPGAGLIQERVRRSGPVLVGLVTAHPAGPMTPFHLASGVTQVSVVGFAVAIALGGPIRAGSYSLLGSSILEWGLAGSALAAVGLAALALIPMAHPRFRALVFGSRSPEPGA